MNEKLRKSLKTTLGIVKFMKVMVVIAFIFAVIMILALPTLGNLLAYVINSGSAPELEVLFGGVSADALTDVMRAVMIPALASLVITFIYTKKAQELLRRMNEEAVFAAGYGNDIRSIGKLMIIEIVGGYILTMISMMIFAPQGGTSSVSFNVSGLFTVAFVYLASYLMDHAYNASKKDEVSEESHVVYIEPMIGDGREE